MTWNNYSNFGVEKGQGLAHLCTGRRCLVEGCLFFYIILFTVWITQECKSALNFTSLILIDSILLVISLFLFLSCRLVGEKCVLVQIRQWDLWRKAPVPVYLVQTMNYACALLLFFSFIMLWEVSVNSKSHDDAWTSSKQKSTFNLWYSSCSKDFSWQTLLSNIVKPKMWKYFFSSLKLKFKI